MPGQGSKVGGGEARGGRGTMGPKVGERNRPWPSPSAPSLAPGLALQPPQYPGPAPYFLYFMIVVHFLISLYLYIYLYIYMATCKYLLSKLSIMEAGSGEEGPAAWRPGRPGPWGGGRCWKSCILHCCPQLPNGLPAAGQKS